MSLAELLQQMERQIAARVAQSAAETRQRLLERLERSQREAAQALAAEPQEAAGPFLAADQIELLASAAEQSGRAEGQREGREEGRAEGRQEGREAGREESSTALRDGLRRLDRAASQVEVLRALLEAARTFAGRSAVFLTPREGVRGWGASGFGGGLRNIDELAFDFGDSPWDAFAAGRGCLELTAGDCARIVSDLDPALPLGGVLVPLVLRNQVAAALYADQPAVGDRLDLEPLQVLAFVAAQSIELLAFRDRRSTPSLLLATEAAAEERGLALWESLPPAPAAVTLAEPEEEIEATAHGTAYAPGAPMEEELAGEREFEMGEEVESIPLREPEMPSAPEAPVEPAGDFWAMAEAPAAAAPAAEPTAWTVEPEPLAPPAIEPEPAIEAAAWEMVEPAAPPVPFEPAAPEIIPPLEPAAATFAAPPAPSFPEPAAPPEEPAPTRDLSEDETVMLQSEPAAGLFPPPSSGFAESPFATTAAPPLQSTPPPSLAPAPPVPPPPAEEAPKFATRGAEILPPADLSGPGWAFSTTRIPVASGDEALHEEARRLARLLVSEIKLYNEEQVEEGRRNRDVYHRLRDDIDRSRQLYEERVAERIRATTDYFYQELVRNLAGGDARALGM